MDKWAPDRFDLGRDGLDRLAAAKLHLISEPAKNMPYLSTALFALMPVSSAEVQRMTVDEKWRVYVNPGWLAEADVRAIAAELAHVVWHLLHAHADRARDMRVDATTAEHWHQAADAALVQTLAVDGLVPSDFSTPDRLALPLGLSAEEYYAMLSGLPVTEVGGDPEEPTTQGCGSGADGVPRAHELPDAADMGAVDYHDARHIRERVAIDYREHISTYGNQSRDALRWAKQILEPKIAWQPLLSGAVRRAAGWANGHTDYTYSKRSRRQFASPNVVLPGTRRPLPTVAMVIDTSGSVDDTLLGQALGEVDGALRGLGVADSEVTVLACDASVHTVARIRQASRTPLAGGGGTDMREGIAVASATRPRPDLIVILTDGYTPWPATPPPGSAVICAILGREGYDFPPTPAWATRVECIL